MLPKKHIVTLSDVQCYLWLLEKMHWKVSVKQVLCFMQRIWQVQQRRMLYLSLPIDSDTAYCIRYGNIMGFSLPNFLVYGQDPRKNSGKYGSKETCIFLYFTHCDVSCLLTQKRTHFCTRIIVLKITILREMFS